MRNVDDEVPVISTRPRLDVEIHVVIALANPKVPVGVVVP